MSTQNLTALVTAIASLVVAITALIKVIQTLDISTKTHAAVKANQVTIARIDEATNGTLTEHRNMVEALLDTQATTAEIAARMQTNPPAPMPSHQYIPGVTPDRRTANPGNGHTP